MRGGATWGGVKAGGGGAAAHASCSLFPPTPRNLAKHQLLLCLKKTQNNITKWGPLPFSHLSHLDGVPAFPGLLLFFLQQHCSICKQTSNNNTSCPILLFSPIYFIIKAVVDFPGKLILEHPRTRTHKIFPWSPHLVSIWGFITVVTNICFFWGGEGKRNEDLFCWDSFSSFPVLGGQSVDSILPCHTA